MSTVNIVFPRRLDLLQQVIAAILIVLSSKRRSLCNAPRSSMPQCEGLCRRVNLADADIIVGIGVFQVPIQPEIFRLGPGFSSIIRILKNRARPFAPIQNRSYISCPIPLVCSRPYSVIPCSIRSMTRTCSTACGRSLATVSGSETP